MERFLEFLREEVGFNSLKALTEYGRSKKILLSYHQLRRILQFDPSQRIGARTRQRQIYGAALSILTKLSEEAEGWSLRDVLRRIEMDFKRDLKEACVDDPKKFIENPDLQLFPDVETIINLYTTQVSILTGRKAAECEVGSDFAHHATKTLDSLIDFLSEKYVPIHDRSNRGLQNPFNLLRYLSSLQERVKLAIEQGESDSLQRALRKLGNSMQICKQSALIKNICIHLLESNKKIDDVMLAQIYVRLSLATMSDGLDGRNTAEKLREAKRYLDLGRSKLITALQNKQYDYDAFAGIVGQSWRLHVRACYYGIREIGNSVSPTAAIEAEWEEIRLIFEEFESRSDFRNRLQATMHYHKALSYCAKRHLNQAKEEFCKAEELASNIEWHRVIHRIKGWLASIYRAEGDALTVTQEIMSMETKVIHMDDVKGQLIILKLKQQLAELLDREDLAKSYGRTLSDYSGSVRLWRLWE